jgi:pimeloyl-ACP methyl ester carboxylesterase
VTRRRTWLVGGALLLGALALLLQSALVPDIPVAELLPAYANGASKFVDVEGMSVHYRDEGTGPPLVLLHGTGASLHTWNAWTAALSSHRRVIRMDLPGFGLTGPNHTGDYSIPAYVAFLESFRQALGLTRFALGGNSLGGQIAWSYAVAHPERVTELILVDSAGFPIDRPALVFTLARTPGLSKLLAQVDPSHMVRKTLREAYGDPSKVTPELVERYRLLALRQGNRSAFVARAKAPPADMSADLPLLRVPTLVLWGREDRLIPVGHASRFLDAIPGAELVLYDGVGHVPMEEIGERSARDVDDFLSRR